MLGDSGARQINVQFLMMPLSGYMTWASFFCVFQPHPSNGDENHIIFVIFGVCGGIQLGNGGKLAVI